MIAILSDIHSNLPALEAVLADFPPGVDEAWVLGDSIGELPFPCETVDRLRMLGERIPMRIIAGNRELSILEARAGLHPDWRLGTQLRPLVWCAEQLTASQAEWLGTLPTTLCVDDIPGGALLFHGAPGDVRGLMPMDEAVAIAALQTSAALLAGGHTHRARRLVAPGFTYINPGSVGLSLDRMGGMSSYALLSPHGNPHITFRRVPYDIRAVEAALNASGLLTLSPGTMTATLRELQTGLRHMLPLLRYARTYAQGVLGHPIQDIPPELWRIAEDVWIDEGQ